jgi:hypothetical protein
MDQSESSSLPVLPRRLGIVIAPAPGESFPSWVDRMAVRLRTGPGWIIRALSLELSNGADETVVPLHYGILLTDRDRRAVHAATGIRPDVLDLMLMSVYDGTVLDLSVFDRGAYGVRIRDRQWGLFRGSRCCPQCLRESGGVWQLWWKLGGAAACPEHRVLLYGHCPACLLPLRWGSGRVLRLQSRTPLPAEALTSCWNRPTGSTDVCGFSLTGLPAREAPVALLKIQDLYLRAAAGETLHLAGQEVTATEWLAELIGLAALARLAGPQALPNTDALPEAAVRTWRNDHAEAERLGRFWRWRTCPNSAELAAALMQAIGPVFWTESEQDFRQKVAWLITAIQSRHAPDGSGPSEPRRIPPFTRRAFMTSNRPWGAKVVLGKILHPEPRLQRQGMRAGHIPVYPNRDDILDLVTPHLVPSWESEPGGRSQRRFAAQALMMMVAGPCTWRDTADLLGLPPLASASNPLKTFRVPDPLAFREAISALGQRLVDRGLIDYAARRNALADLIAIPPEAWATRPGAGNYSSRWTPRFAAAWVWAELTGGHADESPAFAALSNSEIYRPSTKYNWWKKTQPAVRLDWLRDWAMRYLRDRGCPVELP